MQQDKHLVDLRKSVISTRWFIYLLWSYSVKLRVMSYALIYFDELNTYWGYSWLTSLGTRVLFNKFVSNMLFPGDNDRQGNLLLFILGFTELSGFWRPLNLRNGDVGLINFTTCQTDDALDNSEIKIFEKNYILSYKNLFCSGMRKYWLLIFIW